MSSKLKFDDHYTDTVSRYVWSNQFAANVALMHYKDDWNAFALHCRTLSGVSVSKGTIQFATRPLRIAVMCS